MDIEDFTTAEIVTSIGEQRFLIQRNFSID